ncbi:MAG TPA: ATP-binding cassette domain-containing protein [Vicinamibacterales bacterium]|nr:ATP-binding cassette domain-containing protein [Vicinamibacterales bacterium]
MTRGTPVLAARGLRVAYPGVLALDGVDFDVCPGEVHALVGQNGAGKSTLIRVLSGGQANDEGELLLDGRPVRFASPADALRAGIASIPQELQLVSTLSAADNIFLGREPLGALGLVDSAALRRRAAAALTLAGAEDVAALEPDTPVQRLETGHRQLVAIARALSLDARVLIMDEPSSSLGPAEVRRLEQIVRDLAARGVALVYVSHRLDEVCRLATRVTVLRDGRRVAMVPGGAIDGQQLVQLMTGVGRPFGAAKDEIPVGRPFGAADLLLQVEHLSLADPGRPSGYRLHDVSLSVHRGEILGLSGLIGAGRTDLLLALTGALDRLPTGRVIVGGRPYRPRSPVDARRAGIALLPEDRKDQGIFPDLDVRANITISRLACVSPALFLSPAREAREAGTLMDRTGVRCASGSVPIATLSGGNQQKTLLARCLFASPSVLLLDEPTRGVDVAAKSEIYALIRQLAASGFGIVLCSSEMPEILALAHRVVVFRDGRLVAALEAAEATEEKLLAAATTPAVSTRPKPDPTGCGGPPHRARGPRLGGRFASLVGLLAVLVLAVVLSPVRGGRPVFLDVGNLTDILRQVAEKGILAAGMTPVIISGGIDLSVGSVLALAATLTGWLLMRGGLGVWAVVPIVIAAGCLWGLVNGLVVARWRLQAFIATLATMSAARGVARYISGGAAIPLGFGEGGAPEAFRALAAPIVPFVPVPAVLFLLSVAAVAVLMSRMRAGRYVYAIGDNEQAARLSGVNVRRYKALVYVLCGGLAALAGVIHCAQLEQGNPNDGVGYELDAIAAVVIGGTSLSGGVGTVGGTLVGTLIIGIINNSMGLNNVDANLQLILKGVIILAAVWLQTRRGR